MRIFGLTITTARVVAVAATALSSAVAATAKAGNPIGNAAIAAVAAAESTTLTGPEKKAQVVAAIVPIVTSELTRGGLSAIVNDVEAFAGLIVEEVVSAMKQTPLVQLATALLKLLGLKVG